MDRREPRFSEEERKEHQKIVDEFAGDQDGAIIKQAPDWKNLRSLRGNRVNQPRLAVKIFKEDDPEQIKRKETETKK